MKTLAFLFNDNRRSIFIAYLAVLCWFALELFIMPDIDPDYRHTLQQTLLVYFRYPIFPEVFIVGLLLNQMVARYNPLDASSFYLNRPQYRTTVLAFLASLVGLSTVFLGALIVVRGLYNYGFFDIPTGIGGIATVTLVPILFLLATSCVLGGRVLPFAIISLAFCQHYLSYAVFNDYNYFAFPANADPTGVVDFASTGLLLPLLKGTLAISLFAVLMVCNHYLWKSRIAMAVCTVVGFSAFWDAEQWIRRLPPLATIDMSHEHFAGSGESAGTPVEALHVIDNARALSGHTQLYYDLPETNSADSSYIFAMDGAIQIGETSHKVSDWLGWYGLERGDMRRVGHTFPNLNSLNYFGLGEGYRCVSNHYTIQNLVYAQSASCDVSLPRDRTLEKMDDHSDLDSRFKGLVTQIHYRNEVLGKVPFGEPFIWQKGPYHLELQSPVLTILEGKPILEIGRSLVYPELGSCQNAEWLPYNPLIGCVYLPILVNKAKREFNVMIPTNWHSNTQRSYPARNRGGFWYAKFDDSYTDIETCEAWLKDAELWLVVRTFEGFSSSEVELPISVIAEAGAEERTGGVKWR